jgi:hypothetical protein
MTSVRKQLSVVLSVIPCRKLWKTGVGGSLEPIDRRQVLLVGDARHSGYVVMSPVTMRVPMYQRMSRLTVVDLHHRQPIVVWSLSLDVCGILGIPYPFHSLSRLLPVFNGEKLSRGAAWSDRSFKGNS